MVLFRKCCCCSLETTTKIIGWLSAITGTISIIILTVGIGIAASGRKIEIEETKEVRITNETETKDVDFVEVADQVTIVQNYAFLGMIGALLYYVFFTGLAAFLLVGVHKKNLKFVKLWINVKLILIVLSLISILLSLILLIFDLDMNLNGRIASIVIDSCLVLVVHNYYEEQSEYPQPVMT